MKYYFFKISTLYKIKLILKDFKTNDYMAMKYSVNDSANTKSEKFRRQSSNNQKFKMEVEACIIVKHSVYEQIKAYLNTNNHNYVTMYISIHLAHIMHVANHIFKSMKTPLFELEALLVKLTIQTEDNPFFNPDNPECKQSRCFIEKYFQKVNRYFWKHFDTKENPPDCDTILLIHDYTLGGNVIGLAQQKKICDFSGFTSLILFSFEAHMGQVIAHEILHQLGSSYHDNDISEEFTRIVKSKKCPYYLLTTSVLENEEGYWVSECTIDQVIDHLFFANNTLNMATAQCLITTNNPKKNETLSEYRQLAKQELPGHFYSLSDQCRFVLQDANSFVYQYEKFDCGRAGIRCYNPDGGQSIRVLDGTSCGPNKTCWKGKCDDDLILKKFQLKNSLLQSALLLRDTCPYGPDQSKILRRASSTNSLFNCSDLIHKNTDCISEDLLDEGRRPLNYTRICCESCHKALLSQCDNLDGNCEPTTCETLQSNPCYNGGKCVTNKTALEEKNHLKVHFYCECEPGYYGDLCLRFSPCQMKPCKKDQICHEYGEFGHYICLCDQNHDSYLLCKEKTSNWFEDNDDTDTDDNKPKKIESKKKFWLQSAYLYRYYTNISIISAFFLILITFLVWKRKYLY